MQEIIVKITSEYGLHARPAAIFVQEANKFECDIDVEFAGNKINGKSIIGVMSLGAYHGDEIKIMASGRDEEEALESLGQLIKNGFEGV